VAVGIEGVSQQPREHIYLSSLFWDGLWIIQQPICHEIQKTEPVLFVERPVSVFTVLRYPRLWPRLFQWLRGARQVTARLRVLAPLPLFHLGHRLPWLFRLDLAIQRWWILRWAGRSDRARVLWVDHPVFESAIDRMGETLAIYHVGDDAAEFRTSHRATIERLEVATLRKASVVFAAADGLAESRRSSNPRTFAIQNAIDTSVFEAPDPVAELTDVDAIAKPRVAFIGVLDSWVDLELIAATARGLRDVQFVIVGPSMLDDRAVRALENVHFLGPRHRRLVPGILRRVSASLVPFRRTALTARIVPAKIFEALAAGVLPVCTPFSRNLDVFERQGLVAVGRSEAEFIDHVRRAIRSDQPARRRELAAFGMRQTWSQRWLQMKALLDGAA